MLLSKFWWHFFYCLKLELYNFRVDIINIVNFILSIFTTYGGKKFSYDTHGEIRCGTLVSQTNPILSGVVWMIHCQYHTCFRIPQTAVFCDTVYLIPLHVSAFMALLTGPALPNFLSQRKLKVWRHLPSQWGVPERKCC